jgi:SH3 domain protein
MKKFILMMFLILGFISFSVFAQQSAPEEEVQEIKYVTDKLRLSLYKSANGNSGTIKLLTSGDELKLLERSGNYARVKTDEGLVGWVKTGFLVSEPTSSFQLIEEKKKNEILANQLEQYSDTQKLVADYENTISLMKSDETKMTSEIEELQKNFEQAQQKNQQLQQQLEDAKQGKIGILDIIDIVKQYWYVIAGVLLIFVLSGFLAGKRMVESQVKRRFQGVKVW